MILVGPRGWIDLWSDLRPSLTTTRYACLDRRWKSVVLYHRDGHRYSIALIEPPRRFNFLTRALAATVYNPVIQARLHYQRDGRYDIEELRGSIRRAIEADDDVLTQFHDADELIALLGSAQTFDTIVSVLRYAETDDRTP